MYYVVMYICQGGHRVGDQGSEHRPELPVRGGHRAQSVRAGVQFHSGEVQHHPCRRHHEESGLHRRLGHCRLRDIRVQWIRTALHKFLQ